MDEHGEKVGFVAFGTPRDWVVRFPGDSAIDTIGKLHAEIDRLRAENERLEREKAEWERLYEKKQNSYDALVVAYNDLKADLEGGSR